MIGFAQHLFTALDDRLAAAEQLQREIHQHPDLSGAEDPTLERWLGALRTEHTVERIPGSAAAVRFGSPEGPTIAIRAELDALPIVERTALPWASRNGAMHACGHDVHLAALWAVTHTIAESQFETPPVLALLQPREETYPSGALDIIASGTLERQQTRSVIGAHVHPGVPEGTVACTPGIVNAAADEFSITLSGTPGHAAYPHFTRDVVLAAGQLVVSLQQLVSRNTDPMSAAVVTVGQILAGTTANATPATAKVKGTLRSMSEDQREFLRRRIHEVTAGVAMSHQCEATVEFTQGEPALVNDQQLTAHARSYLQTLDAVSPVDMRSCGADDFSYYNQVVPSVMMFVGVQSRETLHSDTFELDRRAIRNTARAMLSGYLATAEQLSAGERAGAGETRTAPESRETLRSA